MTAIKNQAYQTTIQLINSLTGAFIVDPGLEAGDVTVMTDFVSKGNIDTLPTLTTSVNLQVDLSADEMNGDVVIVNFSDPHGVWEDAAIIIETQTGNIDDVQPIVESIRDITEGDITETSTSVVIKKKDTETVVLQKDITGSFLAGTVTTREP